MARIRSIKPEFFSHKGLCNCSPHARLLAIALLQLADPKGRLENIPMQVHAHAFPREEKVKTQVLLGELQDIDYLIQYEIDGTDLIQIIGFEKHQRMSGKEAAIASKYPEYKGEIPRPRKGKPECFPGTHLDVPEQGTGNREQGTGSIPSTTGASPPIDPKKALWDSGVKLLGNGGRSILGKAIKMHGDEKTAQAIAVTMAAGPVDPKTYFLKSLPSDGHVITEPYEL
jgi:hypothetical protein